MEVHGPPWSSGLYAGGYLTAAGGAAASHIAEWDGASWALLDSGVNSDVWTLTVLDDGGGPALFVGGGFTIAGGLAADRIAKWNGSNCAALGSGMSSYVWAMAMFVDSTGLPALYAGGNFESAIDSGDSFLAKWGCATLPPTTYCTAGTSASGCQALFSAAGTPSSRICRSAKGWME